jgi:TPR repeat protein
MIEFINEAYVKGILDDVVADSQRLSRDHFMLRADETSIAACRRDIYSGHRAEVGDFATALRLFGPLAEQGDASAQTNLGVMYEQGRGVAQNYREAMKWFRLAALQGNASAQSNLGVMYYRGQGIAQDYREAMKWYRLGAKQGNAEAMFNLGVMYEQGRGVGQDYARAYIWYNLAASQSSDENAKLAIKARDIIARRLEPARLLRAQDMARQCEVSSLKNCDRADP